MQGFIFARFETRLQPSTMADNITFLQEEDDVVGRKIL